MSARGDVSRRGEVRGVFVFALLAAFAVLSLFVVLVGARSYRAINASADWAFISRTGMSYLLGKVRGADAADQLEILNEAGVSVLALGQQIEGERYLTYIYCDGDEVREYFARADLAFSPDYGEKIFGASSLYFEKTGSLLQIEIVDADGETHAASVYLQAAKEGGT